MAQYEFKKMLLTPGRGGRPGTKITPKALVIHWTANTGKGADAIANRNYFENNPQNKVSAHYVVDDHQVVQCIPENEMAYHVGAKQYTKNALSMLSSYPNNCTIGIEMCVNNDGNFKKTYENTVIWAADILQRYKWDTSNLWRHYDITGKDCPRFFVADLTAREYGFKSAYDGWVQFKNDVKEVLNGGDGMFKDTNGHWAEKDIEKAAELGIVKGKGDGTFAPDENITRAETVVLVMRLYRLLKGVK